MLSYFNETAGRVKIIESILAKSRKGDIEIYTSTLSITEVAFAAREQLKRTLEPDVEAALDAFWADRDAIKLVEPHELIQRAARALMREGLPKGYSLKPMDAIHLASAKDRNVEEFHTYDPALNKYKKELSINICEPYELQQELDLDG